jgi:hypothetical protein
LAVGKKVFWFEPDFCLTVKCLLTATLPFPVVLHTLCVINVNGAGGKASLKKQELKKLAQLRKLGVSGINSGNIKDFFFAISGHRHLESLSLQLDEDNFPDGISLLYSYSYTQVCL